MAASNFDRSLALVLKSEGGYVNNPRDPGGPTNMGITQATLTAFRGHPVTVADVKAITRDEVAAIYRKNYWSIIGGDDLPAGLDYCLFDFGVNSGNGRAVKILQDCLSIQSDGVMGPKTLAAAKAINVVTLINLVCDRRLAWLQRLSTWSTFGKGWAARIVFVRRNAIQMIVQPIPAPPDIPMPSEQKPPSPPKSAPTGKVATGVVVVAGGAAALTYWDQIHAFLHHVLPFLF